MNMENDDFICFTENVNVSDGKIRNKATGFQIEVSGNVGKKFIADLSHPGNKWSELCEKYGMTNMELMDEHGLIESVGKKQSSVSLQQYLPGITHSSSTFFSLPMSNIQNLFDLRQPDVGIIGIQSFSSSAYHTINEESVAKLRAASSSVAALGVDNIGNICGICGRFAQGLTKLRIKDYGDLEYLPDQREMQRHLIRIGKLLTSEYELHPMFVGGDHAVTLYLLQELIHSTEEFQVLQLDAHRDTGFSRSRLAEHGSFIRELSCSKNIRKIIQVGVRGTRSSAENEGLSAKVVMCSPLMLSDCLIDDLPVYVTVDVDAFDPSIVSAVAYPLLDGLNMSDFDSIVTVLSSVKLLGCDVVEYNSSFDSLNLKSACAVSEIILGLLSAFGEPCEK